MSAQVQAGELHGFILPDDGPRYTNVPDGPDKTLFLEGVTATQHERYREAEHTFTALLKNYPTSLGRTGDSHGSGNDLTTVAPE